MSQKRTPDTQTLLPCTDVYEDESDDHVAWQVPSGAREVLIQPVEEPEISSQYWR